MPSPLNDQRIHWADVAKGAAIVLVVMYHVAGAGSALLFPSDDHPAAPAWRLVSQALLPVRMPLFFLVSGLLAANAVRRPWRALWRNRVGNLIWPFFLWSSIFALVAGFAYQPDNPAQYFRESIASIPAGGTAYWYLSVLVVFFLVARLFRAWAPALTIVAVVALGVAPHVAPAFEPYLGTAGATNVGRMAYFGVWFLVGCFGRRWVVHLGTVPTRIVLPAASICYVLLAWLVYVRGTELSLNTTMTVVGLTAAIAASAGLARIAAVARLGRYLAARTLAIYVLHPILLNLLVIATRGSMPTDWAVVIVPTLTVALTWSATALYDLCGKLGLHWLFRLPGAGVANRQATPARAPQDTQIAV